MDDVLCDFSGAHKRALDRKPENKYPQCEFDFFRNLEPIPQAIESVNWLISSPKYDVYILTAPSYFNPMCYTEKRMWVEKYLGMEMVKKLIISPNKGLNKGDYLIDDYISGKGQEGFEGELIHFGSELFPSWSEVIHYLSNKK